MGRTLGFEQPASSQRSGRPVLGRLVAALLASGLAALAAILPARASVVRALALEDLTRKAELIVLGVPTEQMSRRHLDGRMIVTDVSFSVQDVLKGPAKRGQTVVATVLGGKLDGIGMSVPGEAALPIGQRAIVFLYRAPISGDWRVVGMAQGVLALSEQASGTMVMPGGAGAALVQQGSDGQLRDAPDALMQPQPLGALLDRIRQLVTDQAAGK